MRLWIGVWFRRPVGQLVSSLSWLSLASTFPSGLRLGFQWFILTYESTVDSLSALAMSSPMERGGRAPRLFASLSRSHQPYASLWRLLQPVIRLGVRLRVQCWWLVWPRVISVATPDLVAPAWLPLRLLKPTLCAPILAVMHSNRIGPPQNSCFASSSIPSHTTCPRA